MENRLNHIDTIARDALQNMEFPYQPADWSAMESRIEKDAFLRTRLYWLKGGELLLMLLAFWVLFQFTGMTFPETPTTPRSTPPTKQNLPIPAEKNTPQNLDNQEEKTPKKENKEEKVLHYAQNQKIDTPVKKSSNVATLDAITTIAQPSSPIRMTTSVFEENQFINTPPLLQKTTNYIAPVVHQEAQVSNIDKQNIDEYREPSFTGRLPQTVVLVESNPENTIAAETEIDPIPDVSRHPLHFRIAASPDMNVAQGSYRMGMTIGGLASVELSDKWQLETGLAYSGKFFNDLPLNEERFPNMEDFSKDMNLHVAEMPLHVQYTIKKSTNWRPFVSTGFTANAVMFANYDYNEGIESPFDTQREAGILEGGSLRDNLYATADIGLGLERQLDTNLHLFIQPTVKFALDNVGAHHDRIHTFSLVMGARTAL